MAADDLLAATVGLFLLVLIIAPTWWVASQYGLLYAALAGFCVCGLICSGGAICACAASKRSEL